MNAFDQETEILVVIVVVIVVVVTLVEEVDVQEGDKQGKEKPEGLAHLDLVLVQDHHRFVKEEVLFAIQASKPTVLMTGIKKK